MQKTNVHLENLPFSNEFLFSGTFQTRSLKNHKSKEMPPALYETFLQLLKLAPKSGDLETVKNAVVAGAEYMQSSTRGDAQPAKLDESPEIINQWYRCEHYNQKVNEYCSVESVEILRSIKLYEDVRAYIENSTCVFPHAQFVHIAKGSTDFDGRHYIHMSCRVAIKHYLHKVVDDCSPPKDYSELKSKILRWAQDAETIFAMQFELTRSHKNKPKAVCGRKRAKIVYESEEDVGEEEEEEEEEESVVLEPKPAAPKSRRPTTRGKRQ